MRDTVVPHAVFRDTHYYAHALSQPAARECGVRCGVPFPACPQTRQARWLAAKERSNARVSPDHGSEGEDVQLRWRPAHEENSDVIQLYKGLPLLAPAAQNALPRGVVHKFMQKQPA